MVIHDLKHPTESVVAQLHLMKGTLSKVMEASAKVKDDLNLSVDERNTRTLAEYKILIS